MVGFFSSDSDVENMASNSNVQENIQDPGVQNYYEPPPPLRFLNTKHLF